MEEVHGEKIDDFDDKEIDAIASKLRFQKPGNCPFCGKFRKSLKHHIIEIHKKDKPWKCNLCDYSHSIQSGLNFHMKKVHEKKEENEKVEEKMETDEEEVAAILPKLKTQVPGICPFCDKASLNLKQDSRSSSPKVPKLLRELKNNY